jgi:acetyl esterase
MNQPAGLENRELDPQARALLDVVLAAGLPPVHTLPVEQARERMRTALMARGEPSALLRVEQASCPTAHGAIPIRLYRPAEGVLPMVLFLHGGGWTINDLDTHDRLCRLVARRSGCLLAALDYRRAPEHKHPAALEDAYLGYRWLLDNAKRIGGNVTCRAIVGESSGGTMAASLALLLRDMGAPMPTYQVLAYPMTDIFGRQRSHRERGEGYMLDSSHLTWFLGNYLPDGHDPEDRYLFPMMAPDLAGLPSTLMLTAEFDPLRDDGVFYAQRLAGAGVDVKHLHASDQMHGFLLLDSAIDRVTGWIEELGDALAAHAAGAGRGFSSPPTMAASAGSPRSR